MKGCVEGYFYVKKQAVKLLTPGEALLAEKRKLLEAETSEEDEDGFPRAKFGVGLLGSGPPLKFCSVP